MAGKLTNSGKGQQAKEFRHSHALVIGINDYANGIRPLSTPVNDARRLARLLEEEHGYEVHLLIEEVTHARLEAMLTAELPQRVGEDDRLLLYFAGHGVALDGDEGPQGFLVPQDANATDRDTLLPMEKLQEWLDALSCRHMLAILDCCFAGAFRWAARRRVDIAGLEEIHQERYERFLQSRAWQVLTSAAHNQEALDVVAGKPVGVRHEMDGRHSPFAQALFEALRGDGDLIPKGDGDGLITATELYLYLREWVEIGVGTAVRHEQTPGLWPLEKHDHGEYVFLAPGNTLKLNPAPELNPKLNPWRGLESYDREDAPLFFGREQEIAELAERVREQTFTAVLGASGTGKSSLVKAGLLPRLSSAENTEAQQTDECNTWTILTPLRPGRTPLRNLHQLLSRELTPEVTLAGLRDDAGCLANLIETWSKDNHQGCLLLVVDQLEELVTMAEDQDREKFLALLAHAVEEQPKAFRLIITLRTDFEPQFNASGPLAPSWPEQRNEARLSQEQKNEGRYVVPPLDQADLRQVIVGPASERVLYFEPPELVDDLINEVLQMPGALPLLSFTLSEMYLHYLEREERDDRALTLEDYDALGGVVGSLRNRANQVYKDLPKDEHRETMRRVMLRMVAGEGGELARRRVHRSELNYPIDAENERVEVVLRRLVDARLLVTGEEEGEATYEPAHDALVLAWDRLLRWKKAADGYLSLQRRVAQQAAEWEAAEEKDRSGLLWDDDPRLPQLEETLWPTRSKQDGLLGRLRWARQVMFPDITTPSDTRWLNGREVAFVQASVRNRASFWRWVVSITIGVMMVLGMLAAFAVIQADTAVAERNRAVTAESNALAAGTAEAVARGEAETQTTRAIEAEGTAVSEASRAVAAEEDAVAEAEKARRALSVQLASQADTAAEQNLPQRRLLLAIEAVNLTNMQEDDVPQAKQALINALANSAGYVLNAHYGHDVHAAAISPNSAWLALGSEDTTISFWAFADLEQPLFTLSEHEAAVKQLGFGPNQRWFVSCDGDGICILWEIKENADVVNHALLTERGSDINELTFSHSGQWLALGMESGNVKVWDLWAPSIYDSSVTLDSDDTYVTDVVFSPDDRWLVSVGANESQYIPKFWDAHAISSHLEPILLPNLHTNELREVAFSNDGKWLATASWDGTAALWELNETDLATSVGHVLSSHEGGVMRASFSPDNQWLVTASRDRNLRLWDLTKERPWETSDELTGHTGPLGAISISHDSQWLFSAGDDGLIRRWILPAYSAELREDVFGHGQSQPAWSRPVDLWGHESAIWDLYMSNDQQWLLSISADDQPRVWNLSNRDPATNAVTLDGSKSIVSTDGNWLVTTTDELFTAADENIVNIWHINGWDQPEPTVDLYATYRHEERIDDLAIDQDSHSLVWGNDKVAYAVELDDALSNPEPIVLAGHTGGIRAITFAPHKPWVITGSLDNSARIWDLSSDNPATDPIVLNDGQNGILAVAVDQSGGWLATGGLDDTIRLWDIESDDPNTTTIEIGTHGDDIDSILFTSDQKLVTGSNRDNTVKIWNLDGDERLLASYEAHNGGLLLSLDHQRLFNGSWRGEIQLLNISSRPPYDNFPVLSGHQGTVWSMDISESGRLVSGSDDNTVRVWEQTTDLSYAPTIILQAHEDDVRSVSILPQGEWVISSGNDNITRLWNLETSQLVVQACQIASRNFTLREWENIFGDLEYRKTCDALPPHPTVVADFMQQGEMLARGGNIELAVLAFEKAVALDPLVLANPRQEAERLYNQELSQNLIADAEALARALKIEEAVQLLDEALQLDPTLDVNPQEMVAGIVVPILINQGRALAREIKIDEAIAVLTQAKMLDPSRELAPEKEVKTIVIDTLVSEGTGLAENLKVEEANEKFATAAQNDPENAHLYHNRAQLIAIQASIPQITQLTNSGETEDAKDMLLQAVELAAQINVPYWYYQVCLVGNDNMMSELVDKICAQSFDQANDYQEETPTTTQTLSQDDGILWTISAQASQGISLTVTTTPAIFLNVNVVDFDYALVASATGWHHAAITPVALPTSGPYLIIIDGYDEENGNYTINIEFISENVMLAQQLVAEGERLANELMVEEAITVFEEAIGLDPSITLEPEHVARQIAAERLLTQGDALARRLDISQAINKYNEAVVMNPLLEIEGGIRAKAIAFEEVMNDLDFYVWANDEAEIIGSLETIFPFIDEENSHLATEWILLCRTASLYNYAHQVVDGACNYAVELATDQSLIVALDSRGIAHALSGDIEDAIADFNRVILLSENMELVESRREWLRQLSEGVSVEQVFDEDTIEYLKVQN